MPATLIYTREGWIEDPAAVLDAVQAALGELGVPAHARRLRLQEFAASHIATGEKHGERYTEVHVTLLPGRTLEAKQAFFAALKSNLGALGVPEADLKAILIEPPKENWS